MKSEFKRTKREEEVECHLTSKILYPYLEYPQISSFTNDSYWKSRTNPTVIYPYNNGIHYAWNDKSHPLFCAGGGHDRARCPESRILIVNKINIKWAATWHRIIYFVERLLWWSKPRHKIDFDDKDCLAHPL